ncbi:RsmD family RNA methyltransferase [Candidatus Sumerlaeota bacterium]|nr:RsmD family RNA methyltransferase [Candidatus Sumerlaeota bacterium]
MKTRGGGLTRPLAARVKTSLFSIISGEIPGSDFHDFFAGNGAVGIEALSRGVSRASFYEKNPVCVKIIKENLERCGLVPKAAICLGDVLKIIRHKRISIAKPGIAFLGPPYDSNLGRETMLLLGRMGIDFSLIIVEVRKKEILESRYGVYHLFRDEYYGETRLGFFRAGAS